MQDTQTPEGPLTYDGVAMKMARAAHPSLDADIAEAQAAGDRRVRHILSAGKREVSWSLLGEPLPGEYQSPSVACLGALCGVFGSRSFRALHDAVQYDRISQLVTLCRGWGLPDEVIRLRLNLTGGDFPESPPPARLGALREGCLVEAREILREVRPDSPGLPTEAEVIDSYLSAW